ncbi:hypothetical protein [Streptomyces sp. NBC_01013]|uniref:hypothetical protein n=1 Tax=Streptomyces sp. NBC_01013 TaxID=2903718 RepID=UPI00386C2143|nr:hypothetical protein OG538_08640 [Streptomyces sp. NBC_01013]
MQKLVGEDESLDHPNQYAQEPYSQGPHAQEQFTRYARERAALRDDPLPGGACYDDQ